MRRNRIRFSHDEEPAPSSDRYLITYADLITLLLGLFVILYATSQVDASKYKIFAEAASGYFKQDDKKGQVPAKPVVKPVVSGEKSSDRIAREAAQKLQQFMDNGSIEVEQLKIGIKLNLSEKLLFSSGQAELQSGSLGALDSVVSLIGGTQQTVTVDGHTDSIPIRSFQYESNWHLSVARALAVGYYLTQRGLDQKNLIIRGFGAERPLAANATPEGRGRNRRVEIVISGSQDNPADSARTIVVH